LTNGISEISLESGKRPDEETDNKIDVVAYTDGKVLGLHLGIDLKSIISLYSFPTSNAPEQILITRYKYGKPRNLFRSTSSIHRKYAKSLGASRPGRQKEGRNLNGES